MIRRVISSIAVAMSVVVAVATSASGAALGVGGGTVVTGTTNIINPTLNGLTLACVAQPFNTAFYAGTLHSCVVQEAGGSLDFYYQIAMATQPAGEVIRFNATDFHYFTTDVGFRTDAMAGATSPIDPNQAIIGTQGAVDADRAVTGGTVGFDFFNFPAGAPLLSGATSYWHYIRTNAATYGLGSTQLIDGANQTVTTFAPTPEPATVGLVVLGALFALRRRQ